MRRLLAIELAALLPSRDVKVSAAVYALLLFVALLSLKAFAFELPGGTVAANLLRFPDVWHNAAYVGGWIAYLLYVLALQTVTCEYQFRTNRQHVVDGMTRGQCVAGKLLLVAVTALGSTCLLGAIAAGFGLWVGGRFAPGEAAAILGLYGLQVLGYLSLSLFIATCVRRTGAAVLTFVGYTLLAEPLLRSLVLPAAVGRDLPSASFAALVVNPFFGYAGMRIHAAPAHSVVASVLYVGVLAAATAWVFSRQDL